MINPKEDFCDCLFCLGLDKKGSCIKENVESSESLDVFDKFMDKVLIKESKTQIEQESESLKRIAYSKKHGYGFGNNKTLIGKK